MTTILRIPMLIMSVFNFEEYLRIIESHKITRLQTVPPIMIMLSKRPETASYDLSSVKEMLCGAAPLKNELQAAVQEKFSVRITQGWGMTETTCAATGVPWWEKQRSDSVGIIMPNTEVKLLDDDGREVGVGERGELYVRGPQIAMGYWRNEEATRESFDSDGWLKSGDVAVINEEEFMWIVDRKKV
jgi:4-coumarate--CoA ligase